MLRRLVVVVFALLLLASVLVVVFRGPIGLELVRRGMETRLAADPVAELEDGLHVLLCGAGGPLPDPTRKRSGPCVAIVAGSRLYVVDTGSGAARRLARQGFPAPRIAAVLLTHFHSDHIDGLGELGVLRWAGGSYAQPLSVHGPDGVDEVVAGFNAAYRLDAAYRTAHHGSEVTPPTGSGLRAERFTEPANGELITVLERDGLRISAFRVDHLPVKPAVGYRFEYGGRSVVVSGDTSKSTNLERFASGVDLLVHEALSPELMGAIESAARAAGDTTMAAIARDVLTYHASPVEAAESAAAAGAGHLLYYHVVPPMPLPGLSAVFLKGVSEAYDGPVTIGRDGTFVSLPRGSGEIRVTRR